MDPQSDSNILKKHQYKHWIPWSSLVPLTAETGGRWHSTIPPLVRKLAKEYLARAPGLEDDALGAVVARWGALLSALLIRGNGVGVRSCCDLSWAAMWTFRDLSFTSSPGPRGGLRIRVLISVGEGVVL